MFKKIAPNATSPMVYFTRGSETHHAFAVSRDTMLATPHEGLKTRLRSYINLP